MASEPGVTGVAVPACLGLSAFAAIVLTDGTEDLSAIRFTIAAFTFLAVAWTSAHLIRRRHDS